MILLNGIAMNEKRRFAGLLYHNSTCSPSRAYVCAYRIGRVAYHNSTCKLTRTIVYLPLLFSYLRRNHKTKHNSGFSIALQCISNFTAVRWKKFFQPLSYFDSLCHLRILSKVLHLCIIFPTPFLATFSSPDQE